MRRERALAVAAVAVVLCSTAVVAAVPGALSPPPDEDDRDRPPGRLEVEELTISPTTVSGSTATLSVTAYLRHRGNPAENVTVRFRAVDTDTDFVATSRTVDVGAVAGGREAAVTADLAIERAGDYDIEAVVYRNGTRLTTGSRTVYELGSLTPEYARTPIQFHRFDRRAGDLPTVSYSVARVEGGTATLNVSAYLTNAGDAPAGDLTLTLLARQADSNVVADRTTVSIGRLREGRTTTPSARLSVPDDYNYYLVALLQKDGVIVDVAQSGALLNPNGSAVDDGAAGNDSEDGFRAGDFEEETEAPTDRREERTTAAGSGGQPGFGPAAAVAALAALLVVALRRRTQ